MSAQLRPNKREGECPYYLDLPSPTRTQLRAAVKPSDPGYRIRPKRPWFWLQQIAYAFLIAILLVASFGALFVIAEAVK